SQQRPSLHSLRLPRSPSRYNTELRSALEPRGPDDFPSRQHAALPGSPEGFVRRAREKGLRKREARARERRMRKKTAAERLPSAAVFLPARCPAGTVSSRSAIQVAFAGRLPSLSRRRAPF